MSSREETMHWLPDVLQLSTWPPIADALLKARAINARILNFDVFPCRMVQIPEWSGHDYARGRPDASVLYINDFRGLLFCDADQTVKRLVN